MAQPRPNSENTQFVKIGLIDGSERTGRIRAFSPKDSELILEDETGCDALPTFQRIPTSSVAYVAFQNCSVPTGGREHDSKTRLRVHLLRGRTILVEPITDPEAPLGFRASLLEAEDGIEEIFFYTHAISRIELDESIGSMLVQAGALRDEELQDGLGQQAALPSKRIGEILLDQSRIDSDELNRALSLQGRRRVRIGDVLVEAGLASHEDIEIALAEQRQSGRKRIGEILVEMGVVDERSLSTTLAKKFHLPFVDLDACEINPEATHSVPRWILEQHLVLPIEINPHQITLALSDPLDTEAVDLVRFNCHREIREVVAMPSQVERYIKHLLSKNQTATEPSRLEALLNHPELESVAIDREEEDDDSQGFEIQESDSAIIQLANQVLVEAIERNASDIHIEPRSQDKGVEIRIRIDGECTSLPVVPAGYGRALVSRIKIMAKLDIAEQRKPQDGKLRIRLPDRSVELRVATIPTVAGEDIVLRVLAGSGAMSLDQMGLSERNQRGLERLVRSTYGLVLCVGPTGSGKTTSLHSLLGHINVPERKIWTAEDPVEITQPGLRQVEVRPRIGFGFSEALRAFLRADPDVIMVGEMRDAETAEIAIRASLTGHLVLSTLHTNSAPETVVRLAQMGLDPFSCGDALLGVLAQRLARRLCKACRSLEPARESDRLALQTALGCDSASEQVGQLLWRASGCDACRGTGYSGRIALHELLVVDEALRAAIHEGATADRIRELAVAGGMTTMFQDGVQKCLSGATDLQQVLAVCSAGPDHA